MKVTVEHLSQVKKKLTVFVPNEDVEKEMEKTYKKIQSTVSIDGFRKGKAPLSAIKARYGSDAVSEVFNTLIKSSLSKAIEDEGFMPVGVPKVDMKSANTSGSAFTYDAVIETMPKVDITGYDTLTLRKVDTEVTDEDIKKVLEDLRESRAEYKEVERPAEESDLVLVDLNCFVEGDEVKNGNVTDFSITVTKEGFLPGFFEAIKGVKIGEVKKVQSSFPKNFHDKSLAGKNASFDMTLKGIKEKILSDMDDEFAKDLECADLKELKDQIKDGLVKSKATQDKGTVKAEALDKIFACNKFEMPETVIAQQTKHFVDRALESKKNGKADQEDLYLNEADLKWKYRRMAETKLKGDMIIDAIAFKEKIVVSPEEVDEKIREIAESRGESKEAVKGDLQKQGILDFIKKSVQDEKVFDFIISKATMV